ncbi:MAG TPA: exostosin family protein [Flavisolibacter sp.]|jgi:hypothetical protein|nr:exostosin family protein [Flavisolibacter sp.]
MKLFFAEFANSSLLSLAPRTLLAVKQYLLESNLVEEVKSPDDADAIIVQENTEYKDYRYVEMLLQDPFISRYLEKIFTISTDDSATGVLKGLYASIPKKRFDERYHRVVPYFEYTNEYVFASEPQTEPSYMAGWYGNIRSSQLRRELFDRWSGNANFCLKQTESWYNHNEEEKRAYVQLITNSHFSLCPKGWAPPSPRIYESMALGRCPVIISDQFVPPQGPDWSKFALFFPESNLGGLESFLRQHQKSALELGVNAKSVWNQYFAGDLLKKYYANALISLIQSTPKSTRESERKRWQSFSTYWNNNWSIPQRLTNRSKRLFNFSSRRQD